MCDTVIRVENLGKCYTLDGKPGRHSGDGLRHFVQDAATAPFRYLRSKLRPPRSDADASSSGARPATLNFVNSPSTEFWALKEVSFEIKRGEVVGIIGRNGAGKSTLLKILSRITEPTSGRIGIKGRVASLLEVGTGFHPELTGRENIFLNGAILGMARAEIKNKFDEIVEFSGVGRFIDTPVKRYSSGMYVRLAFSVAAHMEPEILVVDEVLAVGDAEFQKKCLGKMKDVAGEGRTVVFVSHNMEAIAALTTKCITLEQGVITGNAPSSDAISRYLNSTGSVAPIFTSVGWKSQSSACIRKMEVKTSDDGYQTHARLLEFHLTIETVRPLLKPAVAIQIFDRHLRPVVHYWTNSNETPFGGKVGFVHFSCEVPTCRLYKGTFYVSAYLSENGGATLLDTVDKGCSFVVEMFGYRREYPWEDGVSVYLEEFNWHLNEDDH